MEIKNLHFYDKDGYELNFNFNSLRNCWEGNIYLPPVSLGLYSNSTIFVLEEVTVPVRHDKYEKHKEESKTEKLYVFPRPTKNVKDDKLIFKWDSINDFVDEIFMFSFDQNYVPNKHTSLSYSYNNGPDCETLLVNKFDVYEVELSGHDKGIYDKWSKQVLPIHVAFSSPVQFDGNTYKRTLVVTNNGNEVVRITYFAESIEEDERLKIWNYNLGYNLKPEDTIIFKDSNIEEPNPDYVMLNEKRKELLIEGHNIYPYVGSYKAILGAIKFFGYDNLNIIEFWRNINPKDENYGKFIMSPKYVLSNRECTFIKDTPIDFPNENYRKGNKLALTYTINTPTEEVDLYELPYVKEDFKFSFGEVLIKLFALRNKLNKEFMPSTSRIIDIIGEASYFGIQLIKNGYSYSLLRNKRNPINLSIDCYPNKTIHITDDRFFNDFIFEVEGQNKNENIEQVTILNNIDKEKTLGDISDQQLDKTTDINSIQLTEEKKCKLYKKYYRDLTYTFLKTEDVIDNDTYDVKDIYDIKKDDKRPYQPNKLFSNNDIDYNIQLGNNISAKVILSNNTFHEKTWNELPYSFKYIKQTFNSTSIIDTFQFSWENSIYDIDEVEHDVYIKWCVTYSDNQLDESFHDNERKKYYDSIKTRYEERKKYYESIGKDYEKEVPESTILKKLNKTANSWKPRVDLEEKYVSNINDKNEKFKVVKYGTFSEMNNVFFELPFIGYYDVKLTMYKHTYSLSSGKKTIVENTKEFKKYIKVEPYNIDIRGFYYDAREIPDEIKSIKKLNLSEEQEKNIIDTLNYFTYIAKHDGKQRLKELDIRKVRPGNYDLQMVMNSHLNKINEKEFIYDINNGPYAKQNFWFGDYIIQDGEFIIDNVNKDVVNLIPNLSIARYIKNGVDVKPYTWIYLTFDYSKIAHRSEPVWILNNKTTGKSITYNGKYFTCLLRDEGNYSIFLSLKDEFGNEYKTERNIVVVDKESNYKSYTSFADDYKSFREYEKYKNDIREQELMNIGNIYEDNTGEYFFSFDMLKLYTMDKEIKEIKYDEENNGRLTIEPGYGIGWGYDYTCEIINFDELVIIFDRPLPEKDNLSFYIISYDNKYHECKITSENTKLVKYKNEKDEEVDGQEFVIKIKDIKDVDLHNIAYMIFFNHNEDVNNDIEIKIDNIYFTYKFDPNEI